MFKNSAARGAFFEKLSKKQPKQPSSNVGMAQSNSFLKQQKQDLSPIVNDNDPLIVGNESEDLKPQKFLKLKNYIKR